MEKTAVFKRGELPTPQWGPAFSPLLPVERLWAKKEAERLLESARQQASSLQEEARAQAEAIRSAARAEGVEIGRRQAAERLADLLRWRQQQAEAFRQALPRLACCLAERLLDESLRLQPQMIRSICRGVLAENPSLQAVTILLNPHDLALLTADGAGDVLAGKARLQGCADLRRGDCILTGSFGEVDGRISVRLEVLRLALERMSAHEAEDR